MVAVEAQLLRQIISSKAHSVQSIDTPEQIQSNAHVLVVCSHGTKAQGVDSAIQLSAGKLTTGEVMHDHFLDGITDVATRFPGRARPDGRYYVVDFTLAEVRSLRMTEPFQLVDGKQVVRGARRTGPACRSGASAPRLWSRRLP